MTEKHAFIFLGFLVLEFVLPLSISKTLLGYLILSGMVYIVWKAF